jgi:hypothetical protein
MKLDSSTTGQRHRAFRWWAAFLAALVLLLASFAAAAWLGWF